MNKIGYKSQRERKKVFNVELENAFSEIELVRVLPRKRNLDSTLAKKANISFQ